MTVIFNGSTVTCDIFFSDLNERTQKDLMGAVGITDPKELNWDLDIIPIATMDFETQVPD